MSVEDRVDRTRVQMHLEAANDYWITPEGNEEVSTQSAIARAAQARPHMPHTLGAALQTSLSRLSMEVKRTQHCDTLPHVVRQDTQHTGLEDSIE